MNAAFMQDWKGKRLGEFGNPPGVPPMQFFYRSDLYRVLYQEARRRGIRIEHGKRLVSAAETADDVTIFTKLAKPEKMAWMFDYRIDWDAPIAPVTSVLQTA